MHAGGKPRRHLPVASSRMACRMHKLNEECTCKTTTTQQTPPSSLSSTKRLSVQTLHTNVRWLSLAAPRYNVALSRECRLWKIVESWPISPLSRSLDSRSADKDYGAGQCCIGWSNPEIVTALNLVDRNISRDKLNSMRRLTLRLRLRSMASTLADFLYAKYMTQTTTKVFFVNQSQTVKNTMVTIRLCQSGHSISNLHY